jgi:hypothetical protein
MDGAMESITGEKKIRVTVTAFICLLSSRALAGVQLVFGAGFNV